MSLKLVLKLGVAALIFAVIAARIDLGAALSLIGDADIAMLVAAVAVSLLIIVADALFWSFSMRPVGLSIGFKTGLLVGIVSWFFINVAPSTVGADLFRGAQLRAAGATTERAIRLVAAARLMSFAALIALIGLGAVYAFLAFDAGRARLAPGTVFLVALSSFIALVAFGPHLSRLVAGPLKQPFAFAGRLAEDARVLLAKTTPRGWLLLIAQHLLRIAGVYCIARALGVDIDAGALAALMPAAFLAAMIPITFGGWGVREASFVGFLGLAGVAAPAAFAISVLFGLTRIIIGAVGGLVWLFTRSERYEIGLDAP